MKRIEIAGHAGNDRSVEIAVNGAAAGFDPGNEELAREAARVLYNTLPGHAWQAFADQVARLRAEVPYANM